MTRYINLYRLIKAYLHGYSIEKPTDICVAIENFFQNECQDLLCCEFDFGNLKEALQDPLVIKNLSRHYIPLTKSLQSQKDVEIEIQKIKAAFSSSNITFASCFNTNK